MGRDGLGEDALLYSLYTRHTHTQPSVRSTPLDTRWPLKRTRSPFASVPRHFDLLMFFFVIYTWKHFLKDLLELQKLYNEAIADLGFVSVGVFNFMSSVTVFKAKLS